jgi:putative ubiquitin-RnfH superfamily antitoxin RatB of RatAB toxin-antitoxin module
MMPNEILIEVAYALPKKQLIIPIKVKEGTTAKEAIQVSGIIKKFPEIDLNINQIGIVITPSTGQSTSVGLDALRINDEDTFDPNFGLISRSVLSTPLVKLAGRQVDVEYRLDLGF